MYARIDPALKQKAIRLRLEGRSYTHILKKLGLKSKGTLSVWFRGLKLPAETKRLLRDNNERASERGFFRFNADRTYRIAAENDEAQRGGKSAVGKLSDRELLLVGAALYWGEGTKRQRKGANPIVGFSNSDPEMIRVFLQFVRRILRTPEERIRAGIHLYDEQKIAATRKYWAAVTGLPEERFYISRLVSRASLGKRGKDRLPYGTLNIRISNRKAFYRIMGLLEGLTGGSE